MIIRNSTLKRLNTNISIQSDKSVIHNSLDFLIDLNASNFAVDLDTFISEEQILLKSCNDFQLLSHLNRSENQYQKEILVCFLKNIENYLNVQRHNQNNSINCFNYFDPDLPERKLIFIEVKSEFADFEDKDSSLEDIFQIRDRHWCRQNQSC